MKDFEKAEREFFSKRCEKLLASYQKNKDSDKTFRKLMDRLVGEDKKLFVKYADEVTFENSDAEEILYSGGFFDGIVFMAKRTEN